MEKKMGFSVKRNSDKNRNCSIFMRFILLLFLGTFFYITVSGCNLPGQVPGNEIESTVPEHGAVDVGTDTTISITFNKPVQPQSLSVGFNPDFEYEKSWSSDNTTLIITPSEDLLKSTTYLITIGIVAFDDNSFLAQPVSFSFDTVVDESQPPAPLAISDENTGTVETIDDNIDSMIMRGKNAETVCEQIIDIIQDDDNVKDVGVDDENNAVWVGFNDGEIQIFQVIDNEEEEYGYIPDDAFAAEKSRTPAPEHGQVNRHRALDESDNIPHYLPANNKALLANSLHCLHPGIYVNDSTNDIEVMLADRGYDVTRHALTLDDFKHLGDYGVILLETHGTWRPLASFNYIIDSLSTQHILVTTTPITSENFPPDKNDILNDRTSLVSWTVKQGVMTVNGVKIVSTIRNYGVTAEYVRQQVNRFTDKTVFFLNGCRGLSGDVAPGEIVSPFKDVLFEKCDKGPVFIGWNGRTAFFDAVRAALNFFQYATASNKDVRVFGMDKRSGKMVETNILQSLVVPWGGYNMTVQASYHELAIENLTKSQKFGGTLQMETKGSDVYENIFMPHPRYVEFNTDGKHLIDMLADTSPDVTIDETKCTLTRKSEDSCLWTIKMPAGAYGDLVVTENERKSIPRKVYKWNPKIKIQGSYEGPMGQYQYTADLSLHARATISAESLRDNPGDEMPAAGFTTEWEKEASTISWKSSGSLANGDGSQTETWSGSGLRYFGDLDYGYMDYESLGFEIICGIVLSYKVTRTEPLGTWIVDGETAIDVYRFYESSGVTSNWTVNAQSFDNYEGYNWFDSEVRSEIISWSAFSPDPLFDISLEPR